MRHSRPGWIAAAWAPAVIASPGPAGTLGVGSYRGTIERGIAPRTSRDEKLLAAGCGFNTGTAVQIAKAISP